MIGIPRQAAPASSKFPILKIKLILPSNFLLTQRRASFQPFGDGDDATTLKNEFTAGDHDLPTIF